MNSNSSLRNLQLESTNEVLAKLSLYLFVKPLANCGFRSRPMAVDLDWVFPHWLKKQVRNIPS